MGGGRHQRGRSPQARGNPSTSGAAPRKEGAKGRCLALFADRSARQDRPGIVEASGAAWLRACAIAHQGDPAPKHIDHCNVGDRSCARWVKRTKPAAIRSGGPSGARPASPTSAPPMPPAPPRTPRACRCKPGSSLPYLTYLTSRSGLVPASSCSCLSLRSCLRRQARARGSRAAEALESSTGFPSERDSGTLRRSRRSGYVMSL